MINIIDEKDQQFALCMSPEEYILQSKDREDPGRSTCMPALQRGNSAVPLSVILGATFMRSFYTYFDVGGKRIGFARSNMSPLPAHQKCTVDAPKSVSHTTLKVTLVQAIITAAAGAIENAL